MKSKSPTLYCVRHLLQLKCSRIALYYVLCAPDWEHLPFSAMTLLLFFLMFKKLYETFVLMCFYDRWVCPWRWCTAVCGVARYIWRGCWEARWLLPCWTRTCAWRAHLVVCMRCWRRISPTPFLTFTRCGMALCASSPRSPLPPATSALLSTLGTLRWVHRVNYIRINFEI